MKDTLDNYFGTASTALAVQLYHELNENNVFTVKETGFSSLLLGRWADKEILDNYRSNSGTHKKFTYIEFIWVKVIGQLIGMGVPPKLIKPAKEGLFATIPTNAVKDILTSYPDLLKVIPDGEEKERITALIGQESSLDIKNESLTLFAQLVCETIINQNPIALLFFTDGSWMPWYENNPGLYDSEELQKVAFETHTKVSLSKLVKDSFLSENVDYLLPKLKIFTAPEIKLLQVVGSGEYESIKIQFGDKQIKGLELTKRQNVRRKIVDILQDSSYQNIEIKTHNGLVTTLTNTVKVKF
ncbi:hypothetical protein JMN32_01865 [Fulvivirga sp. 29W222]|uniref:Uncharacterized protein n=1 Tax=Fulvivirga marina TaxID=2494733 RepID=A0A937KAB2_9BACT|nr:hypothetical protein [Fulvivirga marina]MBL6445036.1 hypothetical protein [Fulvivirga marina]